MGNGAEFQALIRIIMNAKLTVSVGIPAYNEEANIVQITTQLLTQKQGNFELLEIIIISDGSNDRTVAQVESINDPRLHVYDNQIRQGAAAVQNEILLKFKGDILVILNADTYTPDIHFISKLIEPIVRDDQVGVVGAKIVPLPAQNFFEKVINNSVLMKNEMYEQINNKDNIYLCHGRGRAFSSRFAKQLSFPRIPGEDAYSYIECKEMGFKFYYQQEAELLYRSPQSLKDHLKQSKRFFKSQVMMDEKYQKHAKGYYRIPLELQLKTLLKYLLRNPILISAYVIIYAYARINSIWYQTGTLWDVSKSSKAIIK